MREKGAGEVWGRSRVGAGEGAGRRYGWGCGRKVVEMEVVR